MNPPTADDRTLPITRLVSAIIVPFLVLAFIFLYFYPDESGQRFAWRITPHMQAMYVAAGYIGGCYLFIRAALGARWHEVSRGFLPVTVFTISMLLLTLIHWDYFDLSHFPFQVWLVLYVVTPLLVPWLWWNNRHADSGQLEPNELIVPVTIRRTMGFFNALLLLISIVCFVFPDILIGVWPWALDSLSAQAMSGWLALLSAGGLIIAGEQRWSSWRIGFVCIAIWHILVLIAGVFNPSDFTGSSFFNWYTVGIIMMLIAMGTLYAWMESRRQ